MSKQNQPHRVMEILDSEENIIDSEFGTFTEVFRALYAISGVDLNAYKYSTISRRIQRRMAFLGIHDVATYNEFLKASQDEADALYCDLLVGESKFFGDQEVFNSFKREWIKKITKQKDSEGICLWVVGCATGEEAYTIGILIHEWIEKVSYKGKVRIVATDAHFHSIEYAKKAVYSESSLMNVSQERKKKYFVRDDSGVYRVAFFLKKLVVFDQHNVIEDYPFCNVDFISCRNVLMYLKKEIQEAVLLSLYSSLRDGGYLLVGRSEGLGELNSHFNKGEDPSLKIFRRIQR